MGKHRPDTQYLCFNLLIYEIGCFSSLTVLLVETTIVKAPYDLIPARYWQCLVVSKSCKRHTWVGFDIFSLILHYIRTIDLLSFLLLCDPFYFYTREQTRETRTAKIQIICLFSSPSEGLGERVGGWKGSWVQVKCGDYNTYLWPLIVHSQYCIVLWII